MTTIAPSTAAPSGGVDAEPASPSSAVAPSAARLLIVVPALDEEDSIEQIIVRCLQAREVITRESPVAAVEITVVSDGSTDRTVEIASRYADRIQLIVFPQNRGYGAAIQEAWQRSDCELLAFLDADGTCDPAFFAPLCRTLVENDAAIVLGSRLDASSRMPWVRRLGNHLFALLLTVFSSRRVHDTASGMRVVRRSALRWLMPLPDGMHFTPAMTARAVLSDDLPLIEVAMPYAERAGRSKLKLFRDGMRFLRVIVEEALRHRPSRLLGLLGLACVLTATALMVMPTLYYLANRAVLEWMIYRFVVSNLLGTVGCLLFCSGYIADRLVRVTLGVRRRRPSLLTRFFTSRWFFLVPTALLLAGGLLVLPSYLELVETGGTYEHWSRFIVMSFLASVGFTLLVTRLVAHAIDLVAERVAYLAIPATARRG